MPEYQYQGQTFHINPVRGRELARLLQFVVWIGVALLISAPVLARMFQYGVLGHWSDIMSDGVGYSALLGLTVSSIPFGVQLVHTRWHQCLTDRCGTRILAVTGVLVFVLAMAALVAGGSLVGIAWSDAFLEDLSYPGHIGVVSTYSLPAAIIYCGLLNWLWVKAPFDPFTEGESPAQTVPTSAVPPTEEGSPATSRRPDAHPIPAGVLELLSDKPSERNAEPPESDLKKSDTEPEREVP